LSEGLPGLRARARNSIDDYSKKAKEFLSFMEKERRETEGLLRLSGEANPKPREESELNLLRRTLRLNESFNALILISLYALNDLKEYVEALEKHASECDETFDQLLERADEIAEHDRGKPPSAAMIS